ncbi:MAG: ferritin family protein [Deltaproteobacteria bacterium]|nr:ferritin family protein [Deltaproteobacteria bacterium]
MTKIVTLTALEVAKIACNIEVDGSDFYEEAARIADVGAAKETFMELARQEQEHLNTFRNMYRELDEKMGGSEGSTGYLFDDEITKYLKVISEGIVFPVGSDMKKWISEQHDVEAVVKFAIEMEKNSLLFYMEILSHSPFAYSREILQGIIQEEKSHIVMLSRMLD